MAMLMRVITTEFLKLKRTLALWMVLAAPMTVVLMQFLISALGPAAALSGGGKAWATISGNSVGMWAVMMMPLFITLETSLLAGLEHTNNNWKSLLALPAPRWTVYLSKLLVTVALLWAAHLVLIGGTLASGLILRYVRPELQISDMPVSSLWHPLARVSIAALFALAIQHWVSLRWQSFTAALGFGMFAMIAGFVAVNSAEVGPWFPWSMPIHAVRLAHTPGPHVMLVALAGATLVALAGCWEFSRREAA